MFSFFHRTSKIILDCYTEETMAYEHTPIVKASKTIPDYWKELPNFEFILKKDENNIFQNASVQNLKNCKAFLYFFQNAITIRHWTDLYIQTYSENINYDYYVGDIGLKPESHYPDQIGKSFTNYTHIKLGSPWIFREKTGVKISWIGAEWNLDNYNFKILPGVTEFRSNHETHINIMLPKESKSIMIPSGQPLVNLIPLSEKNIVIKNHLVTSEEFRRLKGKSPAHAYFHGWRTSEKLIKKEKEKCPFGFGE